MSGGHQEPRKDRHVGDSSAEGGEGLYFNPSDATSRITSPYTGEAVVVRSR